MATNNTENPTDEEKLAALAAERDAYYDNEQKALDNFAKQQSLLDRRRERLVSGNFAPRTQKQRNEDLRARNAQNFANTRQLLRINNFGHFAQNGLPGSSPAALSKKYAKLSKTDPLRAQAIAQSFNDLYGPQNFIRDYNGRRYVAGQPFENSAERAAKRLEAEQQTLNNTRALFGMRSQLRKQRMDERTAEIRQDIQQKRLDAQLDRDSWNQDLQNKKFDNTVQQQELKQQQTQEKQQAKALVSSAQTNPQNVKALKDAYDAYSKLNDDVKKKGVDTQSKLRNVEHALSSDKIKRITFANNKFSIAPGVEENKDLTAIVDSLNYDMISGRFADAQEYYETLTRMARDYSNLNNHYEGLMLILQGGSAPAARKAPQTKTVDGQTIMNISPRNF